jgi:predicted AlkP superfamily pyrophosphatase or phosphodiesterase
VTTFPTAVAGVEPTQQVMMGDDTWMQLAQHAFAEAHPYPSFNVQDLHTVDDGVWEVSSGLLVGPSDSLFKHSKSKQWACG